MRGHVRERSEGHWAIVIDLTDKTGKRKRKWHSFKGTKRGAQEECARLIAVLRAGNYVEASKETVAAFLERWLTDIKPRVAPRTYERYAEIARKNIVPMLGTIQLKKLKPTDISAAYAATLETGRRRDGAGLSARTVLHIHRVLKQALGQAVQWEMITRNPCNGVKPPKPAAKKMVTYDLDQTAEMIEVARGRRVFVPALLAVLCGMRRGEIAALQWGNVDLASGQLAVVQSAEQTKAGVRYKEPKSGRARTIALPASLVAELRAHRIGQAEELLRLGIKVTDETFVCAREDGKPLRPHSIGQEWVRFLRSHRELPRIRFHDLRHAHATHMLASGVHPKVASERLGHSKIGITLDLYSHVLPNMQADAAALVDDALRAALNKRETKG
jgi:integrase